MLLRVLAIGSLCSVGAILYAATIFAAGETEDADWPEGAFTPRASRLQEGVAPGAATLVPDRFGVAAIGDYNLTFTVGAGGLSLGGSLLVDFPKAWFTTPFPLRKPLQQSDASAPHYIRAGASRPGVQTTLRVDNISMEGVSERFRHVMVITIEKGTLREGDRLTLSFNNTTAPELSGAGEVLVAVDANGEGAYRRLENGATYFVNSGAPVHFLMTGPSQAVVGRAVDVQVVAFDAHYNLAKTWAENFTLKGLDDSAIPVSADEGIAHVSWTPRAEGFVWPVARDIAEGGPIRVYATPPEVSIYWGDLHSHSHLSQDAIGSGNFAFARDITNLDFYASTEHADDDGYISRRRVGDTITKSKWREIAKDVRDYYAPGHFVTLLAYECSLTSGHHNVYYRGLKGAPWPAHRVRSVESLWERLNAGDAFTIPHHTGIVWGSGTVGVTDPGLQSILTAQQNFPGPSVDWTRLHNEELRPSLEIYSAHGQSEFFDPQDPLSYEQVRFTPGKSKDGPHYARDAWAAGLNLGVVAASDDHNAHPGLSHYGLTAVMAPELTREAIFDSIASRRTYGTTGERIILEFEPAKGRVLVAAPSDIRFAEVLAYSVDTKTWQTVSRWDSPGRLLKTAFAYTAPNGGATLYLRVELTSRTNGRIARAWSSPIQVR